MEELVGCGADEGVAVFVRGADIVVDLWVDCEQICRRAIGVKLESKQTLFLVMVV